MNHDRFPETFSGRVIFETHGIVMIHEICSRNIKATILFTVI